MHDMKKPINRSQLRFKCGMWYYGLRRKLLWLKMKKSFSSTYKKDMLPFSCFSHQTILLRRLKDVDMWLQYNKIINLRIACEKLNGILIKPGETFSYWKLIGKPTKRKGYTHGMILKRGSFYPGIGGGLCQLSNLIFWMAIHTSLTVVERHRHMYDVFPDSNRTQPFGSGATCFYPHGDLMIQNNTPDTYQLLVRVGDAFLEGEWRVSAAPEFTYSVVERNHKMKSQYWGGYTRHNEIYKQTFNLKGELTDEQLMVENNAVMMYSPFLEKKSEGN